MRLSNCLSRTAQAAVQAIEEAEASKGSGAGAGEASVLHRVREEWATMAQCCGECPLVRAGCAVLCCAV